MRRFFIYCLPRSGSAWLSLFLTHSDSFCFHDPLGDKSDLLERMEKRPETVVGAVDTGAYRSPIYIPGAQYFVLKRSAEEIVISSKRFAIDFDAHKEERKLDQLNFLRIDSSLFCDVDYLEFIWGMITGLPFDRERAEIMAEMRIERDVKLYFANRPYLQSPLHA